MRTVFQIAGGIVLAVVTLACIRYAFIVYEMKQLNATVQYSLERVNQQAQQRKQQIIAQRQAELAHLHMLEQQRLEEARKKAEEDRQREAAWAEYYKEPYNCKHPSSPKEMQWCDQYFMKAKADFQRMWSKRFKSK